MSALHQFLTHSQLCLLIPGAADPGAGAEETSGGAQQSHRLHNRLGRAPGSWPRRAQRGGQSCPGGAGAGPRLRAPHPLLIPQLRARLLENVGNVGKNNGIFGQIGEWERLPSCRGDSSVFPWTLLTHPCKPQENFPLGTLPALPGDQS